MNHFTAIDHPTLGRVIVEWDYESKGYPGNNWDDPGAGAEIYFDAVYSLCGTIQWFIPNIAALNDEVNHLVLESGDPDRIANEPDMDWVEY